MPASIERAGNWIFGTGFRSSDARTLFEKMDQQLRDAGSSMSRVARLDQYYPDARCVPGYHAARKQAFGAGQIAPSTSVSNLGRYIPAVRRSRVGEGSINNCAT